MLRHWREDSKREVAGLMATRSTRGKPPYHIHSSDRPAGWVPDPQIHTLISPRIEVLPGWNNRKGVADVPLLKARRQMNLYGQVLCNGHFLCFWSKVTERMPDKILRLLIAHELAHVYQNAIGDEVWFGLHDVPSNGDRELDADILAGEWGYIGDEIDQWAADEGIARVVEVKTLEEFLLRSCARYF